MLDPLISRLLLENDLIYKNKSFFYVFKRDKVSVFIICSWYDKNTWKTSKNR